MTWVPSGSTGTLGVNDLSRLHEQIAHGWCKLNDDGFRTLVGSPPHLDLYRAVRSLDNRLPVPAEMSEIFAALARRIIELYPERVQTKVLSAYDARIALMEFNDHPDTTQADALSVVRIVEATNLC
jgi:hypothetical protein